MSLTYSEVKHTKMSKFGAAKGLLWGHARRRVAHALKSPKLLTVFLQSIFLKTQVRAGVTGYVIRSCAIGW